jgi:ubiquitin-protein ligase
MGGGGGHFLFHEPKKHKYLNRPLLYNSGMPDVAKIFKTDKKKYLQNARDWTRKYAT